MHLICCCLLVVSGCLLAACSPKGKPVAWVQRTAPIYPSPRPHDCQMAILQAPPDKAHETIAQIWSYGNEQDELPRMQHLIRFEACQIGAHAVILLPVQDVEHVNTFNAYPDWATGLSGFGQGAASVRVRTNKTFSLSQVGFALVYLQDGDTSRKKTHDAQNNAVH